MAEHDKSAQEVIDRWAGVEELLPGVICRVCGATTATYAQKCSAEWDSACPGFMAVEGALQQLGLSPFRGGYCP